MTTDIFLDAETALAGLRRFPDIFADEYQAHLQLMAEIMVSEMVELMPTGTGDSQWGHLANSFQAGDPVPGANGWSVAIGTPAEYASVIDEGRKPGGKMPPVSEIANWVWHRRYLFDDIKTEKDAARLAFAIARKIAERGFKDRPDGWQFVEKGQAQAMPQVEGIARDMKATISRRCTEAVNG